MKTFLAFVSVVAVTVMTATITSLSSSTQGSLIADNEDYNNSGDSSNFGNTFFGDDDDSEDRDDRDNFDRDDYDDFLEDIKKELRDWFNDDDDEDGLKDILKAKGYNSKSKRNGLASDVIEEVKSRIPLYMWIGTKRELINATESMLIEWGIIEDDKPTCGDGYKEGYEECDDGNRENNDYCTNTCENSACGDGFIQPIIGEECESDADCSNNEECTACICVPKSVIVIPDCGNGTIETGEQCEPPNTTDCDDDCKLKSDDSGGHGSADDDSDYDEDEDDSDEDDEDDDDSDYDEDEDDSDDDDNDDDEDDDEDSSGNNQGGGNQQGDDDSDDDDNDDDDDDEEEYVPACGNDILDEGEQCEPPGTSTCGGRCQLLPPEGQLPEGCFRSSGSWTGDRNKCDRDQKKFYKQVKEIIFTDGMSSNQLSGIPQEILETITSMDIPVALETEEEEEELKVKIREEYVSASDIDKTRKNLLKAIKEARRHLTVIRENVTTLPAFGDQFLAHSIGWLNAAQEYVGADNKTEKELQEVASLVKQLVTNTDALLAHLQDTGVLPSSDNIKIENILDRLGNVLDAMPRAFLLLEEEDIEIELDATFSYIEARIFFEDTRKECLQNNNACSDLWDVFEEIDAVQSFMDQAIRNARRSDLKDEIDKFFEE